MNEPERHPKWTTRDGCICIALAVLAASLRVPYPDLTYLNVHAARDIYRAYLLVNQGLIQWFGPELNFGGRTLGPAVYYLLAPPQFVSPSPTATYLYIALLGSLAPPLVYRVALRYLTPWFAALAGLLAAVNPTAVVSLRYLWNPVFLFPLCAFLLLQTLRTRERPTRLNWALFGVAAVLAVQVHFSCAVVAVAGFLYAAHGRWMSFARRHLWALAGAIFLLLSPALIGFAVEPESFSSTWTSPERTRPGLSKIGFNPNAILAAASLASPDSSENSYLFSFTHFDYLVVAAPGADSILTRFPVAAMDSVAPLAWLLVVVGWGCAFLKAVRRPDMGRVAADDGTPTSRRTGRRDVWLLLVAWVALPILMLSWYDPIDWIANGHMNFTPETAPPSYIPKRYLYQIFPGLFVCGGLACEKFWQMRAWRGGFVTALLVLVVCQGLLCLSWLAIARDSDIVFMRGNVERKIPSYRSVAVLCDDLRIHGGLGRRDVTPDRLIAGWEFGIFDLELELDYPLRLALRNAPGVGDVADDEVVLIQRRIPLPPGLRYRKMVKSGRFRVVILSRAELEESGIYRGDSLGPYFGAAGKAGMFPRPPRPAAR